MIFDDLKGPAFATYLSLFVCTTLTAAAEPTHVDSLSLLELQEAAPAAESAPPPVASTEQLTKKFGEQNSLRFMVEGAWINDWDGSNMIQARVGLGWFFLKNVELDMFITADYVDQWGPDAFGGGFDLQLRWHFLAFENWTVFAEIGGGVLGTSHSVPANGSPFNFTPNAGVGFTYALDQDTRLYVGASWFHISNAGTYANNPGRENMTLWLGLSFGI